MRYTQIADTEVEQRLSEGLAGIAADMAALKPAQRPLAVYLGGGYGRGDGGVALQQNGSRTLYNDLDFFVFGKNALHCRTIDRALQPLHVKWSEILNVEVEFSAAKTKNRLSGIVSTLMFQELLQGHQQIFGDRDVLQELPRLLPEELPPVEGIRLFLNRGAGLLFAAQRILAESGMTAKQRDFAVRNLHKAVLGCADGLLLTQHRYCWKSSERLQELNKSGLPFAGELAEAYAQALAFKAQPRPDTESDLLQRCEQIRLLWRRCLLFAVAGEKGESIRNLAELRGGLLHSRFECCDSPLRNALRWLLKTARPLPLRQLTVLPLLRVLLELCEILFENPIGGNYINRDFFSHAKSYDDFVKHWGIFN